MEGKETSPSCTSESSVLDLPSVCDLAEHFLPPHSSENSEELYSSGDIFPSPPTVQKKKAPSCVISQPPWLERMWVCSFCAKALEAGTSLHSLFSAHSHIRPAGRLVLEHFPFSNSSCFTRDDLWYPGINSTSGFRSPSARPSIKMSNDRGESNPSSTAPAGCSAEGSEEADVRCYPKAGLCEPSELNDTVLSWIYERDSAEGPSIRESLDGFYKMYCQKQPERKDPTYEAASLCLSQKMSELEQKDGTKYVSRCLQMAQLVLNRDGCKIFPNHPPSACFSEPAEGEVLLENRRIPGLSDDILQFLLKQTQAEPSPDGPHKK